MNYFKDKVAPSFFIISQFKSVEILYGNFHKEDEKTGVSPPFSLFFLKGYIPRAPRIWTTNNILKTVGEPRREYISVQRGFANSNESFPPRLLDPDSDLSGGKKFGPVIRNSVR